MKRRTRAGRMGMGPGYAAIDRYMEKNGPTTVQDAYNNATLVNGKLMQVSVFSLSTNRISMYFKKSGKYVKEGIVRGGRTQNYAAQTTWRLKDESDMGSV